MKLTKFHLLLIGVLVSSGCAQRTSAPKLSVQQQNAVINPLTQSMHNCARANITDVDDLITDASYIAIELANRCSKEYQTYVTTYLDVTNTEPRVKTMVLREAAQDEYKAKIFLPDVLEYRAAYRKYLREKESSENKVKANL
ncbi:TPA: hypothetical protein MYU63_004528 [Citrobacter amalonaticus]|uniref:hypothetical protein n=1 Tax=Citrobacter amalonaticus TaxID=35703 RepID=UPI003890A47E|nr:hypothetical protein [Citrobacter amalonaticus]